MAPSFFGTRSSVLSYFRSATVSQVSCKFCTEVWRLLLTTRYWRRTQDIRLSLKLCRGSMLSFLGYAVRENFPKYLPDGLGTSDLNNICISVVRRGGPHQSSSILISMKSPEQVLGSHLLILPMHNTLFLYFVKAGENPADFLNQYGN